MKGLGNFLEHNWFFSLLGTYFFFWWPIACVRSFLNSKIQIDDGRKNVLDCFAHGFASLALFYCAGIFLEIVKPSLSPPRTEMVGPLPAMSYLTTLPSFSIYTKNYALLRVCLELAKVCGDGGAGINMTLISLYSYDLCLRNRSFPLLQKLCNAVPSTAYLASHCKHTLKDLLVVLEIPPSLLMHRLLSSTA